MTIKELFYQVFFIRLPWSSSELKNLNPKITMTLACISHHCGKMGCKSLQNWKKWLIRLFLKKRIF
ncbi:MAG: hypothetical protein KR126chlam3_01434, partial [Chlamydiae bacterium]|nr:hypothetical protein [Chlamydiota bacterium]